MPVLCATVSFLSRPNIFRYQLVSISLMSAALCRCCDIGFPEPRLTSWELLRWAFVPLCEATECFRCKWGGWCPPKPPLLRAASMAPEGAPSPQGQGVGITLEWVSFRFRSFTHFLTLFKSQKKKLKDSSPYLLVVVFTILSTFLLSRFVCFSWFDLTSFPPLSDCPSFCLCSVLSGLL